MPWVGSHIALQRCTRLQRLHGESYEWTRFLTTGVQTDCGTAAHAMAWPGYNNTHTTDPRPPLSWAHCLMKSTCTDGHQALLTDEAYNGQRAGAARIAARIAANSGASASAHAACPGRAPVHAKQLAVFSRRVMCLGRAATCCLIYNRMAACDLGKLIAIGDDWGPIMCWLNSLVGCQIVIQWLQLADRICNHFGNTFQCTREEGRTPTRRPLRDLWCDG
jgi:hypothetical protein